MGRGVTSDGVRLGLDFGGCRRVWGRLGSASLDSRRHHRSRRRHSTQFIMTHHDWEHVQEATQAVRTRWSGTPLVGIVLGTGLGALAREIEAEATIPYPEIPHFPRSTVESHKGQLVCGELAGRPVVAMEGRFHLYEGYSAAQVTFPIRVM